MGFKKKVSTVSILNTVALLKFPLLVMSYQNSQSLLGHKNILQNIRKDYKLQSKQRHAPPGVTIQKDDIVWINAMFQYFGNNLESSKALSVGKQN